MLSIQQLPEVYSRSVELAVIGSGPGGYEAALRAAKAGMKVCLIEKADLGGVCVNWGCIPTKTLLRSAELFDSVKRAPVYGIKVLSSGIDFPEMVKRSRNVALKLSKGIGFMLRRAGVEVVQGEALFSGAHELGVFREGKRVETVRADNIIVASGARFRQLPGLEPDGKRVITSKEALALPTLPASLIVVGGGAIGVEMAWFYAMAGSAVTLIELLPRILPLEDAEISEGLKRSFQKSGITVFTGAKLDGVAVDGGQVSATLVTEGGETQSLSADHLLVAVGVTGNIDGLALATAGVQCSRGFIVTDGNCRTSVAHIFAVGDVRGGMLLAHKASAEAVIAVDSICGKNPRVIYESMMPRCVYSQPSVASVGLSEEQAISRGYKVTVGRSMFAASGKANAYGNIDGFVKLVFNAGDGKLLGGHILGHGAVELIGELTLARRLEVTAELLAGTVHAHPTLSESIKEAAENALHG